MGIWRAFNPVMAHGKYHHDVRSWFTQPGDSEVLELTYTGSGLITSALFLCAGATGSESNAPAIKVDGHRYLPLQNSIPSFTDMNTYYTADTNICSILAYAVDGVCRYLLDFSGAPIRFDEKIEYYGTNGDAGAAVNQLVGANVVMELGFAG